MTTPQESTSGDGPVIDLDILFMMTGLGMVGYTAVHVFLPGWGVIGAGLGAWIGYRYVMSKRGY